MSNGQRVDDGALLDAARACVLDVGFRRTTLTDVARRAGVSRMTLYRRFADVRSLVVDLMTREVTELLRRVAAELPAAGSHRERLVARASASVAALWDDPLLARVLDVDPELLLPYVVDRVGATQRLVEPALQADVAAGQADGSVRAGDPAVLTRALYLVLQSFVLSARPAVTDLGPPTAARAALLAELAALLDGALRPLPVAPGTAGGGASPRTDAAAGAKTAAGAAGAEVVTRAAAADVEVAVGTRAGAEVVTATAGKDPR